MKLRIRIPGDPSNGSMLANEYRDAFVDDVIMWAWEINMDADLYGFYQPAEPGIGWPHASKIWAVFTVDPDDAFMFCLRWGATMHKGKKKEKC